MCLAQWRRTVSPRPLFWCWRCGATRRGHGGPSALQWCHSTAGHGPALELPLAIYSLTRRRPTRDGPRRAAAVPSAPQRLPCAPGRRLVLPLPPPHHSAPAAGVNLVSRRGLYRHWRRRVARRGRPRLGAVAAAGSCFTGGRTLSARGAHDAAAAVVRVREAEATRRLHEGLVARRRVREAEATAPAGRGRLRNGLVAEHGVAAGDRPTDREPAWGSRRRRGSNPIRFDPIRSDPIRSDPSVASAARSLAAAVGRRRVAPAPAAPVSHSAAAAAAAASSSAAPAACSACSSAKSACSLGSSAGSSPRSFACTVMRS